MHLVGDFIRTLIVMFVIFYRSQLMADIAVPCVICLFVCSVMVCVCDPELSARTLHIRGLHLHQESFPWLACAAGTAA